MLAAKAKNTLTIQQLESALKATAAKYGATVNEGIENGRVRHEDGLPWFEVSGGSIDFKNAEDFAQELADAMRCRILLNSATAEEVQGVMDFDEANPGEDGALPALEDPEGEVEGYGTPFEPR